MDTGFSGIGQIIWKWVDRLGLDAESVFAQLGLNQSVLRDLNQRIPVDKWDAIVRSVIHQVDDPCVGLHAARCWHPSDLGAFGYAWLASSSLRSALYRLQRYGKVIGTRASVAVTETRENLQVTLEQKRDDQRLRETVADFYLSMLLDMCRFNYGEALRPTLVTLTRSEPKCSEAYFRYYGCEIIFSAPKDGFKLSVHEADRALSSSNKQLAGVHDKILIGLLAALDKEDIAARCKAVILENIANGEVAAEDVAEQIHMSARTMNRRLGRAGTGFTKLLDDTRRELAEHYLADSKNSATEVTFLLGFSHQSSLTRAAKRWFGMAPRDFRRSATSS